MNFPTYTMATVMGTMTYGYVRNFRRWGFNIGTNTRIIPCHGAKQGHKIARIIAGSVKRSGKMVDGLANSNIDRIISE